MSVPDSTLLPGVIGIKLRQQVQVNWVKTPEGRWRTGHPSLDMALNKYSISQAELLFAAVMELARDQEDYASVQRMTDWGLGRWFCLRFPDSVSPKDLWQALNNLSLFESVIPLGKIQRNGRPNDSQFAQQWHLENTGQSGGTAGADVRAVSAWDINTGSPDVIVAVHDGGVLLSHPDLEQNSWIGKGFNFVTNSNLQQPDNHGTHVGGIVAAVRNNGVGVSGLAGGNGSVNSGVRIMSLQIVGGTPVLPAHEAQSFIYAANNGAAVSQNSWSYQSADYFPDYMADAIDYFIENGGGSVLKGGLVLFSAGNSGNEARYFPAPYSRVIAVGATDHNDIRATYSNYGTWMDLVAPGGESDAPILSTVLNNGYGNLFGTSMSCPLASAASGLIVSHLPGRLLADDVRSLLLYGVDDIYPVNAGFLNGKLGTGRLNAHKALLRADSMKQLPVLPPVGNARLQQLCDSFELSWNDPEPGMQVMIAYAKAGEQIGHPFGQSLAVGDTVPFGGKVVYKGNANQARLPMPLDGESGTFRLWVNDGSIYNFSIGTDLAFQVPFTASGIHTSSTQNSILIAWTRQCPQRGMLLAYSLDAVFGVPAGDPAGLHQIDGGGEVLQYGMQSSYEHTALVGDKTYYYALYPFQQVANGWVYGKPVIIAASTSCQQVALPVQEGFQADVFPPAHWRIVDGGPEGSLTPDFRTWQRSSLAGNGDSFSALINAYTQNGGNSKELLRTPAFAVPGNLDSLIVSFDYAYRAYSGEEDLADSLELVWTTDCGNSLHSIWKAGGVGLATVPELSTAEFIPRSSSDWKHMQFNLLNWVPSNTTVAAVGLIGTNKFGQNLWVDNIRVQAYAPIRTDVSVSAWVEPANSVLCSGGFTPTVAITNTGEDTIKTVRLVWGINGIVKDSADFNALKLPKGKDTVLTLKPVVLQAGAYRFVVYSTKPNGLPDEKRENDTLQHNLSITAIAVDPFQQGFESGATLPLGWASNPAFDQWLVSSGASTQGLQSIWTDRIAGPDSSRFIELQLPTIQPKAGADSLFLEFDVAAAKRSQGGSVGSDTLEVWLSSNCSLTRQLVYRKAGDALVTTSEAPADPFVPTRSQWRREVVDLTPFLPQAGSGFQTIFRLLKGGGNNLYLDEVKVFTRTIPLHLKQAGFGVYPNPFKGSFTIWHLKPQPGWKSARLMDMLGRVLMQWQWNGNAPQTLLVPAHQLPIGMYQLHLQYTDGARTVPLLKL